MPRLRYDPDRDYYAVLGVADSANQAEIQRAFRRLAKTYHPDRNPHREEWAKAAFQAVSEAYSILGTADSRQHYDRLRWPHVRHAARVRTASNAADWAAQARAAYTTENEPHESPAWTSADWARRPPSPPPRPEFSAGSPFISLRSLLRGPYGSLYVIMLVVVLFMPVSYMAVMRFNGIALDSVVLQAAEDLPAPACAAGSVMIDTPLDGASVPARFTVTGTASAPALTAYVVEWAYLGFEADSDLTAARWERVATPGETSVNGAALAEVSLPAQTGIYALRLVVVQEDGAALPPCVRIVAYSNP